jgi:hypothetical protein
MICIFPASVYIIASANPISYEALLKEILISEKYDLLLWSMPEDSEDKYTLHCLRISLLRP